MNTIVGSGPARKPLPYWTDAEKREAVERAICCCERWDAESLSFASDKAIATRAESSGFPLPPFVWWPSEIQDTTLPKLREMLRALP